MTNTRRAPESDRGMTGIGVLILFIALVLVAAIASGLILDTAGQLQNTAQETGEQSTSEVSDRLSVLSASGQVGDPADGDYSPTTPMVTELSLTVYRSPGASDVDLKHASIEYFSPDGTAFLISENAPVPSAAGTNIGNYSVSAIKDGDNSTPVLNSRDDRASIDIQLRDNPTNASAMDYLAQGESATLRITTQSGATTTEIVNVPESLAGYEDSTVLL